MDAQQQLVTQASVVAAVLARGIELALVELTGKPDAVGQSAALRKSGFTFHGLVGMMANGRVAVAANNPLGTL